MNILCLPTAVLYGKWNCLFAYFKRLSCEDTPMFTCCFCELMLSLVDR